MAPMTRFDAALKRGEQTANDPSRPVSVEYRPEQHAFMIMHGNGVGYLINIDLIEELQHATQEQLNTAAVDGFSKALRIPACNVDIYLPGLLAKILFDASDFLVFFLLFAANFTNFVLQIFNFIFLFAQFFATLV